MRLERLEIAICGLLAGCSGLGIDDGTLGCSVPAGECPRGFHCAMDGRCWHNGGNPEGTDSDIPLPDLAPAFVPPAGTVAISFSVDDTANRIYGPGDLEWKSQTVCDPVARTITYDGLWSGPYPLLYDDGSWDAGGHEPLGAQVGDHLWGVTVFARPPSSGTQDIAYGLSDAVYAAHEGAGWLWPPSDNDPNGHFLLRAGDTTPIFAAGMKFPAFGDVDLQLVIDTMKLATGAWDVSGVAVKSDSWGWGSGDTVNDGTGKYTFTLSANIGAGKALSHSGLLNPGDEPAFIFLLGASAQSYGDPKGVSASCRRAGGSWTPLAVIQGLRGLTVTLP